MPFKERGERNVLGFRIPYDKVLSPGTELDVVYVEEDTEGMHWAFLKEYYTWEVLDNNTVKVTRHGSNRFGDNEVSEHEISGERLNNISQYYGSKKAPEGIYMRKGIMNKAGRRLDVYWEE